MSPSQIEFAWFQSLESFLELWDMWLWYYILIKSKVGAKIHVFPGQRSIRSLLLWSWNDSNWFFLRSLSSNLLWKVSWQLERNAKLGQRVKNNWATLQRACQTFALCYIAGFILNAGLNWIYKSGNTTTTRQSMQCCSKIFTFPFWNKIWDFSGRWKL